MGRNGSNFFFDFEPRVRALGMKRNNLGNSSINRMIWKKN